MKNHIIQLNQIAMKHFTSTRKAFFACLVLIVFSVNPHAQSPLTAADVLPVTTVYQYCNFGTEGFAVSLPVGDYTLAKLEKKKIIDDQISSIQVSKGFEVELFEFDDFQGKSVIYGSDDICLIDNRTNDWTTSVKVRAVQNKE
jgi:hypothetical protein